MKKLFIPIIFFFALAAGFVFAAEANASAISAKEHYLKMKAESDNVIDLNGLDAWILKYGSNDQIIKYNVASTETKKIALLLIKSLPSFQEITITTEEIVNNRAILNIEAAKPGLKGRIELVLEDNMWKLDKESWTPLIQETVSQFKLKSGDLIKSRISDDVYVVKDDKRIRIQNPEEFSQKGYRWDKIQEISSYELSRLPVLTSESVPYSNGTLVKSTDSPIVYIIVNGKKRPIPDPATFNNWGLKWDQIKEVPASKTGEFEDIKVSSDIIRAQGNNKIYRIIGDKKLWIPTIQAFLGSGYKPNSEIDITQDDIADFEDVKYIKVKGGRYVYEIKDDKKYRIADTSQIPAQDIKPVTLAEFVAYPIGR